MIVPQSVKLLLARGQADTDLVTGIADVSIKIPGTFGLDANGNLLTERTIEGGKGIFSTQEPGDFLTVELRDDDNLLGYGAGFVLDTYHDLSVPTENQGWYFLGDGPMADLKPLVSDDPTELPSGMYIHVLGHKAIVPTPAHTLYINLHWGKRIR